MAAPHYVPRSPSASVRSYEAPGRRPEPWLKYRVAELAGRQPLDDRLGVTGPDPGYALTMAARYRGRLALRTGTDTVTVEGVAIRDVSESDALRGAAEVAMKRAALAGRAPILADVTVALTIWGFLDSSPAPELVALRSRMFAEVHVPTNYPELRRIADAVPAEILALPPARIEQIHRGDWRAALVESVLA